MTQEYGKNANGIVLWLACAPGVLWVCAAAGIFLRRSLKDGARMGLTREQIRKGIRGASIASVGPCVVGLSSMLALMGITGSPIAWLRVNVKAAGYCDLDSDRKTQLPIEDNCVFSEKASQVMEAARTYSRCGVPCGWGCPAPSSGGAG